MVVMPKLMRQPFTHLMGDYDRVAIVFHHLNQPIDAAMLDKVVGANGDKHFDDWLTNVGVLRPNSLKVGAVVITSYEKWSPIQLPISGCDSIPEK